ncbi:hypothetical protein M9H77_02041 [Catharanthus roseus]|uniref:Uncharacterized protein n=1 Tax=Catharanthus roseus TaxID=4058 RepID=A0ACC0C7E2_CATRO|nr:hypothetical protein M9H77_02041 [Catharanthus roseus]
MRMGPDIIHDQNEACIGGQGRRLDKRFAWRCSGHKEEACFGFGDVLGADDEVLGKMKGTRIKDEGLRSGEAHMWFYILHKISVEEANLTERFSKSKQLEELHKHQTGDKKGQYMDFQSKEFKAEEETTATGADMPNELHHMATIAGGLSHGRGADDLRRAESVVSSVCATFDEYMRRFANRATCRTPLCHQ